MLARLERIETLDRERALPGALLDEVRALLAEAEAWARAERTVPDATLDAVAQCREKLGNSKRTLLA